MTPEPLTFSGRNPSAFLAAGGHTIVLVGVGFGNEVRRLLPLMGSIGRLIGIDEHGTWLGADVTGDRRFQLVRAKPDDASGVSRVGALAGGRADVVVFTPGSAFARVTDFLSLLRPGGLALFTGVKLDEPHGLRGLWQQDLATTLAGARVEHLHALGLTVGTWWKPPAPPTGKRGPTVSALEALKHAQRWAELPAAVAREVHDPNFALSQLAEGLYCHGQRTRALADVATDYVAAFDRFVAAADANAEWTAVRFVRTLRYHAARGAALSSANHAFTAFRRKGDGGGRLVGLELAACQLENQDVPAAQNLLRALAERWPSDLDIAYHLVATHPDSADPKITRTREQVFARALTGREPVADPGDRCAAALARLHEHRFAFLKRAIGSDTVERLAAWAASQTVDGHLRGGDGRLGPQQWLLLMRDLQDSGLHTLIDHYLSRWFAHPDSYVKVLGGGAGHMAWHQDGGTSNSPRRYATFWLALHPCGVDRPGIEIVSYPLSTILPAGPAPAPRAAYAWSVNEAFLPPPTRWAPAFEPGDLLIFHKYVPHATQMLGRPTASRSSVDFRLHSLDRDD